MRVYEPDPLYRNARREALVLLVIFALALGYTFLVSMTFGYGRDPAEVVTYFGIPDWVLWGIFAPWTVCVLVTIWFCFVYMADDPLESDEASTTELPAQASNALPPSDEEVR